MRTPRISDHPASPVLSEDRREVEAFEHAWHITPFSGKGPCFNWSIVGLYGLLGSVWGFRGWVLGYRRVSDKLRPAAAVYRTLDADD